MRFISRVWLNKQNTQIQIKQQQPRERKSIVKSSTYHHISLKVLCCHAVSSFAEFSWQLHRLSHEAGSWQRNQDSLRNDFARLLHGTTVAPWGSHRCPSPPLPAQSCVLFIWLSVADGLISGGTLVGGEKTVVTHGAGVR